MRKVVKGAKYCEKCGATLIPEVYKCFCDLCKEEISKENVKDKVFRITVFWKDFSSKSTHKEFCSYKCAREWLINFPLNMEMVLLISLPYLYSSESIKEFLGV